MDAIWQQLQSFFRAAGQQVAQLLQQVFTAGQLDQLLLLLHNAVILGFDAFQCIKITRVHGFAQHTGIQKTRGIDLGNLPAQPFHQP